MIPKVHGNTAGCRKEKIEGKGRIRWKKRMYLMVSGYHILLGACCCNGSGVLVASVVAIGVPSCFRLRPLAMKDRIRRSRAEARGVPGSARALVTSTNFSAKTIPPFRHPHNTHGDPSISHGEQRFSFEPPFDTS